MKTLLKNAKILSMKEGEDIYSSSLVIDNGTIVYIGEDIDKYAPYDKIIDIKGNVIMPGFKNAHSHGAMVFGRALTDGVSLEDWLNNNIFPLEAHLTPKMCYTFTKEAVLEYLTSGITASSEMYYFMDSVAKVADEFKYRLHLVIGSVEFEKAKEGLDKLNSPYVSYDIALHSVYTPTEEEFDWRENYVKKNKAPFYIHASETEKEVSDCKAKHNGSTPIQYLDSRGFFNYGGVIYHANYLDEKDYEIIKNRGIIPVTCAGSNAKLASGICPVRELLDRDIPVAIGTDGPASNDSLDMFYEMKLVASLQKISKKDPAIIKPMELLKMATVNGARAMHLDNCLYVDVGQKADLIEIDLQSPSMQPINDIASNIVLSGSKDIIKMTMVDGNVLYRDHKFYLNEKPSKIYKETQKLTDKLRKYKK